MTGRLLRDQLVLKCSQGSTAALIILKQWHPYSRESNPIISLHTRHILLHKYQFRPNMLEKDWGPFTIDHFLFILKGRGTAAATSQITSVALGFSFLLLLIWSLPTFVFGLVSFLSLLTRRGKGAPPVVNLTYFLNKFAAAPFQPPRMVIFHFTKVTRSENCGQSWASSPKLGAAASRCQWTPHKDTDRLFAKHQTFCTFCYAWNFWRKTKCCTLFHSLEEEEDFLTILLSVWM